jgi:hypothetical protein
MQKIFILFLLINTSPIYCQNLDLPYNIIGDRKIQLSEKILSPNMSGIIITTFVVNDSCKLLSFSMDKILISDPENENIISFHDFNSSNLIRENKTYLFKLSYYPLYVQFIYNSLEECIKKLIFEYNPKGLDNLNKKNIIKVKFNVN